MPELLNSNRNVIRKLRVLRQNKSISMRSVEMEEERASKDGNEMSNIEAKRKAEIFSWNKRYVIVNMLLEDRKQEAIFFAQSFDENEFIDRIHEMKSQELNKEASDIQNRLLGYC